MFYDFRLFSIISSRAELTDFSSGGDLLRKLENNDTPDATTGRIILTELITGLEAVQSSRIVHQELSPKNVLIDNEGHIRLIDFGLSWFFQKDSYTRSDWSNLFDDFKQVFRQPVEEPLMEVYKLLKNMTLSQVPGKV